MNYFVSNIDFEAVAAFLFIGVLFCIAYSAVSKILCIIKSRYIIVIIKNLFLKPPSLVTAKDTLKRYEKKAIPDAFRAIAIISLGIVMTFALYALCDGVPRLYALLVTAIGYILAYFLLDSTLLALPLELAFSVIYTMLWVIVLPIKGFICLARQKRLKSDKK